MLMPEGPANDKQKQYRQMRRKKAKLSQSRMRNRLPGHREEALTSRFFCWGTCRSRLSYTNL